MAMRIVRLGSPRQPGEGLRIGTVRRPPRGVPKKEIAERDIYDVWFPNLAPSEALLKEFRPVDDGSWRRFQRYYRAQMKGPLERRDIQLLAALSHHMELSVGCYCEDDARCHRSLLRDLLAAAGADIRGYSRIFDDVRIFP